MTWNTTAHIPQNSELVGFGFQFQSSILSGYRGHMRGRARSGDFYGYRGYMQHAQTLAQNQQMQQLIAGIVRFVLAQLSQMNGGDLARLFGGQALKGDFKGKWLAAHGGYKKTSKGAYTILKGRFANHRAIHYGNGNFQVYNNSGGFVGIWKSPTKSEKLASPLTFDLNGDGKVGTTGVSKDYDINGDGVKDKTAWAGKGDGVLAFDRKGVGQEGVAGEDGRELLGDNADIDGDGKADGHKNGFDALSALAVKHLGQEAIKDGKLDAEELKRLGQSAGLRMLVDGKSRDLGSLGISELNLSYKESTKVDRNGNHHKQIGAGFTQNGELRAVNDVWFRYASGA